MFAPRACMRRCGLLLALLFSVPSGAPAHTIPDDVTVQMFAKPDTSQLHLLVRVPFDALADTIFPFRARGDLDLPLVRPMLPDAARIWIADWIDLYEDGALLPQPQVVAARVSLASDRSFASYDEAWARLTGPDFPGDTEVFPSGAMFDVALDYPIHSPHADFTIQSRLARLGGSVVTALQYLPPDGPLRTYGYIGNPGVFALNPGRYQTVERFFPLGFVAIIKGSDYWLFLLCAALLLRRWPAPRPYIVAFVAGHSATLIASAYGLAPEALWFPVFLETLIALSIVYLALENIFGSALAPRGLQTWMAAFGFGLAYGYAFSFSLRLALQFGGQHVLLSILSFNAGVELAILLVLVSLMKIFALAFRLRLPERVATIFAAGLAAHTGWHRMLDRARWLSSSQPQWPTLDPTMLTSPIAIMVAGAILAATAYFIVRATRREAHHRGLL